MGKGSFLGEFEQIVILGLMQLGDDAHGVAIRQEIERRTERVATIGSVYATLERLENKGYLSSRIGEPTPQRGGRAKRYYRVLRSGRTALESSRRMVARMSEGLVLDTGGES